MKKRLDFTTGELKTIIDKSQNAPSKSQNTIISHLRNHLQRDNLVEAGLVYRNNRPTVGWFLKDEAVVEASFDRQSAPPWVVKVEVEVQRAVLNVDKPVNVGFASGGSIAFIGRVGGGTPILIQPILED